MVLSLGFRSWVALAIPVQVFEASEVQYLYIQPDCVHILTLTNNYVTALSAWRGLAVELLHLPQAPVELRGRGLVWRVMSEVELVPFGVLNGAQWHARALQAICAAHGVQPMGSSRQVMAEALVSHLFKDESAETRRALVEGMASPRPGGAGEEEVQAMPAELREEFLQHFPADEGEEKPRGATCRAKADNTPTRGRALIGHRQR